MKRERVVMISGGNRGIGKGIAQALYHNGWRLALGMRKPALPDWASAEDVDVDVHAYDASTGADEQTWVQATMMRFGRIDAVIANAGIMIAKNVVEAVDVDLDAMLEVNVKAPRRLAKAAWTALGQSGRGRVIIVSSLSGKRVKSANSGLYAISKFGSVALAHALRHHGWNIGIRVTALCPGFVATDMGTNLSLRDPAQMTSPADLGQVVITLLNLPNEASVAELTINCQIEESY